jgi:O-acetyl-ADP-ribose deacetylase
MFKKLLLCFSFIAAQSQVTHCHETFLEKIVSIVRSYLSFKSSSPESIASPSKSFSPKIVAGSQTFTKIIHTTLVMLYSEPRYDITCAPTQAIVNPANSMLLHAGGVAYAISNAAGQQLQIWSNSQPIIDGVRVPLGQAVISPSFDLKAAGIEFIIHTIGPDFRDLSQQLKGKIHLYNAWYNALLVAHNHEIDSITFPSISTGIFNCPQEIAAQQASCAIHDFLRDYPHTSLRKIVIGLWQDTWDAYKVAFLK